MIELTRKQRELMEELKVANSENFYHSVRVKNLTFKLLKLMTVAGICSYSPEETDIILKGALLHDIGKLYVSNRILTKDSALTEEEKKNMNNHTSLGFEAIENDLKRDEYDIIKNICLYHHERVDGKGYNGLTEIELYVKIVALCDVFDALHSDRIYRDGLSTEKTLQIIKEGGCGYFEPELIGYLVMVTANEEE